MLDCRQEILDIIDKESSKYNHTEQYIKWGATENTISGCCINGLVMLHFGWKPDEIDWKTSYTDMPESWQEMALFMRKRYGDSIIGDINVVNASCNTWSDCKKGLREFWELP